jgi:hypothetical protein
MIIDKSKEGRRTHYATVIIITANLSAVATIRIKYNRATHYSIMIGVIVVVQLILLILVTQSSKG